MVATMVIGRYRTAKVAKNLPIRPAIAACRCRVAGIDEIFFVGRSGSCMVFGLVSGVVIGVLSEVSEKFGDFSNFFATFATPARHACVHRRDGALRAVSPRTLTIPEREHPRNARTFRPRRTPTSRLLGPTAHHPAGGS